MVDTRPNTKPRPRRKVTWWLRMKYRLLRLTSPLRLRGSITRLSHHNKRPFFALLRLCLPSSWLTWSFPVPEPLSPNTLIAEPSLCWRRRVEGDLKNLQAVPIWRSRDTPLRSLYRLYEAVMAGEEFCDVVGYETEYFWYQDRHSWEPHRIPDPADPDPLRYAILACIAEALVLALNWRLSLGMRRNGNHIHRQHGSDPYPPYNPLPMPSWVRNVPAVSTSYLRSTVPGSKLDSEGRLVLIDEGNSEIFRKRNIIASEFRFYTI
ncbi:hypothetical protein McanMca71_002985 [Microsporum canis]|uniref:Uncharacterized protein n=1 Tax=Arthroderma otae (strain ATCC MYA-4605 / CBS 113480) TaxID=554155 RepID=C5G0F5_ARTOC|nr:conserved hypothetical protein [Microsporum canis CBS 113480]EEQ35608.1 conserved hypothetical protein [Microsporum canis CBS 113480]